MSRHLHTHSVYYVLLRGTQRTCPALKSPSAPSATILSNLRWTVEGGHHHAAISPDTAPGGQVTTQHKHTHTHTNKMYTHTHTHTHTTHKAESALIGSSTQEGGTERGCSHHQPKHHAGPSLLHRVQHGIPHLCSALQGQSPTPRWTPTNHSLFSCGARMLTLLVYVSLCVCVCVCVYVINVQGSGSASCFQFRKITENGEPHQMRMCPSFGGPMSRFEDILTLHSRADTTPPTERSVCPPLCFCCPPLCFCCPSLCFFCPPLCFFCPSLCCVCLPLCFFLSPPSLFFFCPSLLCLSLSLSVVSVPLSLSLC